MPSASPAPASACAVLAGGAGARLGGDKHLRDLAGQPLGAYPLAAAEAAGLRPVLVAKVGTAIGPLLERRPETLVVREPATPVHPLAGVLAALEELAEPIVVCPCDTPHISAELLTRLAESPATVVATGEGIEPLIGRWEPLAVGPLRAAVEAGTSARALAAELGMARLDADPALVANVNTEADLALSAEILRRPRS